MFYLKTISHLGQAFAKELVHNGLKRYFSIGRKHLNFNSDEMLLCLNLFEILPDIIMNSKQKQLL